MTKPVTIPNTFATATTAIPLSNLDADFSTVATAMNDANTYSNYAPDTGSANAYVVTLTGVSTTYSAGLRIQFKAGNANTTASTLNVNAQGAKNITYQDASAIASGTIAANSIVDVMYDGTQFLLMNDPAGGTGGDVVGPASATDNAIVRFDGTTGKLVQNSVVTIADSTGDISGVGQLNATTVDTTNIEVTNIKAKDGTAAASIADSTGVVSITANPVLSGGTANGVLYLNGSKVATSGAALTFDGTNFATTGTATATKLIPTGNVTAGNGMFLPTTNTLAWSNNGSETLRLDSSGNLGLGVTPSAWSGTKAFQFGAAGAVYASSNDNYFASNAYYDGSNFKRIAAAASGIFGYDGTWKWLIAGSSTAGSTISFTQAMTLDASGRLGIGTTSPNRLLSLYDTQPVFQITNVASGNTQGTIQYQASGSTDFILDNQGSGSGGNIIFMQAGSERARIDTSGNLLVGTTSANPGGSGSDGRVVINTLNGGQAALTCYNAGTGAVNIVSLENGNGQVGRIQVSGTSTSYLTSSDYRLKENVKPMTGALAKVQALKPCTFKWKVDGSDGQGFIAHELQDVCPDAVGGDKDAVGADGNPVYQGIDTSFLVATLTAAIQEQQALIQQLTARVAALESN